VSGLVLVGGSTLDGSRLLVVEAHPDLQRSLTAAEWQVVIATLVERFVVPLGGPFHADPVHHFMSWRATKAVWALASELREALFDLDAQHRPSDMKALLVALRLAEQYREGRGYADDTDAQLREAVGFAVTDSLTALGRLDVWVVHRQGGPGRGARRVPGPRLKAHLDPAPRAASQTDQAPGADPPGLRDQAPGVDGQSPGGRASSPGGVPPDSPVSPRNPSSSRAPSAERSGSDAGEEEVVMETPPGEGNPALDAVLDRAALRIGSMREETGAGPAGVGAQRSNRGTAAMHARVAQAWLEQGHSVEAVAEAVALRVTRDLGAVPAPQRSPARAESQPPPPEAGRPERAPEAPPYDPEVQRETNLRRLADLRAEMEARREPQQPEENP